VLASAKRHSGIEDKRNPVGEFARRLEALKLPSGNRDETTADWLDLEVAAIRKLPVFIRDFRGLDLRVGADKRKRVLESTSRLASLRGVSEVHLHLRARLLYVVVRGQNEIPTVEHFKERIDQSVRNIAEDFCHDVLSLKKKRSAAIEKNERSGANLGRS
jgi:hypothetical protein